MKETFGTFLYFVGAEEDTNGSVAKVYPSSFRMTSSPRERYHIVKVDASWSVATMLLHGSGIQVTLPFLLLLRAAPPWYEIEGTNHVLAKVEEATKGKPDSAVRSHSREPVG